MLVEKFSIDSDYNDLALFAIVSDNQGFKLAWELNRALGFNLIMADEKEIEFKGGKKMVIQYFNYQKDEVLLKLIKNHSIECHGIKNPYLVNDLKNYPFLLLLDGETLEEFLEETLLESKLVTLQKVQLVKRIDLNSVNIDNLIF